MRPYIVYIHGAQEAYDLHAALEEKKLSASLDDSKVERGLYIIKFWCYAVSLNFISQLVGDLLKDKYKNLNYRVDYL